MRPRTIVDLTHGGYTFEAVFERWDEVRDVAADVSGAAEGIGTIVTALR